ncbi:MAG: hypothetical protein QOC76_1429 [Mycobacterium sp.]|jgi:hypothetical protein|nr:hypothetical protein [Mycobacterium sp.]
MWCVGLTLFVARPLTAFAVGSFAAPATIVACGCAFVTLVLTRRPVAVAVLR